VKDEFGGVAVEDNPTTDEFGGLALEDSNQDEFGGIALDTPVYKKQIAVADSGRDEFGGEAVVESIGQMPPSRFGADIQPPTDFLGGGPIESPFAPTERFARSPLQATPPENPESLQPLHAADMMGRPIDAANQLAGQPAKPNLGEAQLAAQGLPPDMTPITQEQADFANRDAWEKFQQLPADLTRAGVADVAFALTRNFQNLFKADPGGGNIQAVFKGEPLPIDEAIGMAAQESADRGEFPTAAAAAQLSQDIAATAPMMLGFAGLPGIAAKALGAAFVYKMMREAPETFRALGDQMGKPKDQQDPALIAKLFSAGAQEIGFSALGLYHGIKSAPHIGGDLGTIRDAAGAVKEAIVPGSVKMPRQEAPGYNRAPFKPQRPEMGADVQGMTKPKFVMEELSPEMRRAFEQGEEFKPQPPPEQPSAESPGTGQPLGTSTITRETPAAPVEVESSAKTSPEAQKFIALEPKDFVVEVKNAKRPMTLQSYDLARKITGQDIAALEAAEKSAKAKFDKAMEAGDLEAALPASSQKQFFNETVRYRKALDAIKDITDPVEIERIGKELGVEFQPEDLRRAVAEKQKPAPAAETGEPPSTPSPLPENTQVTIKGKNKSGNLVERKMDAREAEGKSTKLKTAFEALKDCMVGV
jgi:hypothetical protein